MKQAGIALCSVLLLLVAAAPSHSQFIMEQEEYYLPLSYELLPEDMDFENPMDEARYFLALPEETLKSAPIPDDEEVEMERATFYLEGNNIAVEAVSTDMGKTTTISNYEKGTLFYVLWAQKVVLEIKPGELQAVNDQAEQLTEEMMENLSPEMRAEMEALEDEEYADEETGEPSVQATGESRMIRGFDCKEYIMKEADQLTLIWATEDKSGVGKTIRKISEKMDALFPADDEEEMDEWDLITGMIPIEVRSIVTDDMAYMLEMEIRSITRIEKTTPPAEKFRIPGEEEGFVRTSFGEFMSEMMNSRGQ